MLTNVFTRSLRERWLASAIGPLAIGAFLVMGMAVYRGIDLSLYADLPDSVRSLMGFSGSTDAGSLAYGAIYSFMGALTLAGVAIAGGSGAIAGEERTGTMGLLLANPLSRTSVLVAKAAALLALTTAGALLLWGAAVVAPALLDVDVTGMHPGALVVHMWVNALFYGFFALAISSWTGNQTVASAVAAALMVAGYLAVSILPLVDGLAELTRAFPWYYYDGSDPLTNGIGWRDLGVLGTGALVFAVAAVVGLNRRDLRRSSVAGSLLDRLRQNRVTSALAERLAGSARVSHIWVKTASEHQGLLVVLSAILLSMGMMMGPLYSLLDADLTSFADNIPDALSAMVGGIDLATPEGWYMAENFSLVVPIALIVGTVVVGTGAIAGEEESGNMGLLLASPISRTRVVVEKSVAMVVYAVVLGVVTFVGTVAGSVLAGLDMSVANIAGLSLLGALLGLLFGAVSMALGAATGRKRVAVYGAVGCAVVSFLYNTIITITTDLVAWARLGPFHYYLSGEPLSNGISWTHVAVLAGASALLLAVSPLLFERRDLRTS
jgi:ABC-2 type transport system permease protein